MHVIDRSTYVLVSVLSAGPDAVQCVTIDADVGVVVCGTANGRVAAWQVSLCTVVPLKQVNSVVKTASLYWRVAVWLVPAVSAEASYTSSLRPRTQLAEGLLH